MLMRRTASVAGLVAVAVLVGGVFQVLLWRWDLGAISVVATSQFTWVLLAFGAGWAWAGGHIGRGAAAGALTGLVLIVSYYGMQWLVDGRHAAVAQLSDSGGLAWTVAAVGGGALMGLLGGLASADARERSGPKALGIVTAALVVGAGPTLWLLVTGGDLPARGVLPAAVVFAVVGTTLLVHAVRSCGVRACLRGLAGALVLAGVALGGLWWLQVSGLLYVTF
ncbi:hypothetical protein [Nocardioides iriomotensis]|uniref:Uncharacterized protein n=1 Tax=Nocardioides iriomotensis TaxID=715784 RepID=A0A4Q5JAE9_9ACTN|nr:hypothetical protein [Nocardioides iriomotensis]RYU15583.1 hypothetical protein ETU37_00225 [Nocardioides iriomotensis]